MKSLTTTLLIAATALFTCFVNEASAAETSGKASTSADAPQLPVVPASLKKMKFVSGKPNLKAKYYIYLYSASWCGHCVAAMPNIVESYPKLRSSKVEIILMGGDNTNADVLNFVKRFKAKFPAVQFQSDEAKKIHGYMPAMAFPWLILMTDTGKTLFVGHPKDVFPQKQWKGMISSYEKAVKEDQKKAAQGAAEAAAAEED